MKVWVTRDRDFDEVNVWTGRKPCRNNGCYLSTWVESLCLITVSTRNSRELFGFTPRKGSCSQYELSLKVAK